MLIGGEGAVVEAVDVLALGVAIDTAGGVVGGGTADDRAGEKCVEVVIPISRRGRESVW